VPEPFAEVLVAAQKLTDLETEISRQRPSQSTVKPNPSNVGIKAIQLQEGDPSKTALIGGIDQVINSMTVLLSFLDCYSGYHQIALKEEDQIKTAFITLSGAYAYTTIPFGLKNAGATYQRAIQLCFADQLHRNIKTYVDDVVIKTRSYDGFIPCTFVVWLRLFDLRGANLAILPLKSE
jgi:hypothetical protein